ncbi:outer envelope pore protein 24, chloroplastic-like [Lycium ferocissimum]|uniref:outer envelope pore protein 24, chloroplastic-like n=1 Tax=Lycium ferocissimum TaxID=112874 RepID=UPI002814A2D3|nr:outer envelope pore protein 24, chloroplastic-like [Lycium ferocissimum]
MNAISVKAGYEPANKESNNGRVSGGASVTFNAGDFKLRASMTDATVVNASSLNGLALAIEKPDSFILGYKVSEKESKPQKVPLISYSFDFSFQFMNSIKVMEKPLNLKYTHNKPLHNIGDSKTILDGTLVFNSANNVSANHELGSGDCKLKYSYVHGGLTTLEPSYDTKNKSWDLAVSRKVYGDHVCKATYQMKSNVLGLEWSSTSKLDGSFKVSASLSLADKTLPKLAAESSLNFDI